MTTQLKPDLSHLDPETRAMLEEAGNQPAYDGKFAPKLSQQERCSILAASKYGVTRNVVAAAFDIDRRTVTHICSDNSPHYRSVRDEYSRLGHQDFFKLYLTPDVIKKVNKAFHDPNVKAKTSHLRADQAARLSAQRQIDGPNPKANKHEGRQSIVATMHEGQMVVVVIWYGESIDGETGWHFRAPREGEFTRQNDKALMTSAEALKEAKERFFDNEQM